MEVYSVLSEGYTKMYIISDEVVTHNRLDVYLQNTYLGSFVGSNYTDLTLTETDKFTKELQFSPVTTSNGPMQIFEFIPTDINQEGPKFNTGVFHFLLQYNTDSPLPLFGVVNDEEVLCCMAKKLQSSDTSCSFSSVESVNKTNAYLTSSKANIRMSNAPTAVCLYGAAILECGDCGCK